jgi:hypothetical protein
MSRADDGRNTTPSASETANPGIDTTMGIQHIGVQATEVSDEFQQVKKLRIFGKLDSLGLQTDASGFCQQATVIRRDDDETMPAVAHPQGFAENPCALPAP